MNRSSEVDPTSVARLLWIHLLNSDAFGRLQGRFALEIGREKQPREIKGPSHTKGAENYSNGRPGGAFGSTLELGIRHKYYQKCYFVIVFPVAIVDGILDQMFSEIPSEGHGLNRVWTAQARADRILTTFGKSRSWDIFRRFRRCFGCPAEPLGRLFPQKVVKCGRWLRSRFRSYGNHRYSPRLKSGQTSKAI